MMPNGLQEMASSMKTYSLSMAQRLQMRYYKRYRNKDNLFIIIEIVIAQNIQLLTDTGT